MSWWVTDDGLVIDDDGDGPIRDYDIEDGEAEAAPESGEDMRQQ